MLGASIDEGVVRLAVEELRTHGLVRTGPAPGRVSRRSLLQALGGTAAVLPLVVSVQPNHPDPAGSGVPGEFK